MDIKEQLSEFNWNYELAEGDYYGYFSLSKHLLQLASENTDNEQADLLQILARLCRLDFDPNDSNNPYNSKQIEELVGNNTQQFSDIIDCISEPLLKNRIADILWLYHSHKNIDYVRIAINSAISIELNQRFSTKDILACWRRASVLATQTKQQKNELYSKLISEIDNSTDESYLKLGIAQIIVDTSLNESAELILAQKMLDIAELKRNDNNIKMTQAVDYLDFVVASYAKSKDGQKKANINHKKGQYLEAHADNRMIDSPMASVVFYKKALKAFQNVERQYRQELKTEKAIQRVRQKINEANLEGLASMQTTEVEVDISEPVNQAINYLSNVDVLDEAIHRFINLTREPDYQKMRETYHPTLIDFLGGMTAVSPVDGRTISEARGIGTNNLNDIENCKSDHATRKFMTSIGCLVEANILPALNTITSEHSMTQEYLESLCEQAPIVPPNRSKLMSKALYAGFQLDFITSTHILCPQFENMIRVLLNNYGVSTSHIDDNGVQTEKGLSTLMDSNEIIELLGENLCFEIKTIFTDSKGYNLRNNIAHGLLDDAHALTAGSVYAWHLTLRLIIKSCIDNQ